MKRSGLHSRDVFGRHAYVQWTKVFQSESFPSSLCSGSFNLQHSLLFLVSIQSFNTLYFISDTELGAGDTERSIFSLTGYLGWSHQWLNSDVYRHGCSETHLLLRGPIQGLGKYIRGGHQRLLFLQSSLGVNRWYGVSRAMRHSRISADKLLSLPTTTQP